MIALTSYLPHVRTEPRRGGGAPAIHSFQRKLQVTRNSVRTRTTTLKMWVPDRSATWGPLRPAVARLPQTC